MKIGDLVQINRCEVCPAVVGKIVPIEDILYDLQEITKPQAVELGFGRGRPQKNRPKQFPVGDVSVVVRESPTEAVLATEDSAA
jgi:hypothetical protein